jgi:hypothetical protein
LRKSKAFGGVPPIVLRLRHYAAPHYAAPK